MLEFDLAQQSLRGDGFHLVMDFRFGVNQSEDAFRRSDGMLHLSIDARQVLDRPQHEGQVGDEGMDAADGHQPDLGLQTADPDDGAQRDGRDDFHGRQEQSR